MRKLILLLTLLLPFLLMASNPVVQKTSKGIELKNDHVRILLSESAELISCIDLSTNQDIAVRGKRKIAYANTKDGLLVEASNLQLENDKLKITLGQNRVDLKVTPLKDYFIVEVQNKNLQGIDVLTFLDLKLDYDYSQANAFLASGIALNLQTNHVYYPSGESKEVIGQCTSHTGFEGARLAVVACKKDALWGIVRDIYRSLPPHSVPVVLSSGGPFAPYSEANGYDCILIGGTKFNPDELPEMIRFYSRLGIKQFEFLDGPNTYIQGQFMFPSMGSASSFKDRITDPLYSEGIISSLHTYSYYISSGSTDLLSDPKWQEQLEVRGEFTLAKDLKADDKDVAVLGDVSYIKNPGAFSSVYSPFILIDNELIRYSVGEKGFINCNRGQSGTTAMAHKKGAKVRVIGGYFGYSVPQIGSELFYEIARRTAIAYNEGGFRGLYFDAIDGLGVHLRNMNLGDYDYQWYYGAAFINEVLKYCDTAPLVLECSHIYPAIWPARGRGECWETPRRGYKSFINVHTNRNLSLKDCQYVTTLGWYNFYPTCNDQPGNYSTKYMFSDDVDYLGAQSIAYDQTMVYQGLRESDLDQLPALKRNLDNYSRYAKLRLGRYFSDDVKNKLKNRKFEYKLEKKNGIWGLKESVYCKSKIRDISKDYLEGTNPFDKQKPFMRLENLYSSNGSSAIHLMSFNENEMLPDGKIEKRFPQPINIENNLGIKVNLKGEGIESKNALCIRLLSEAPGYADYVVRLNFDGWREIVLSNLDNAETQDLEFKGREYALYSNYYYDVDFSKIKSVQLFKAGDCKNVRLKSIEAVPIVSNSLTNPKVVLGNSSITFNGTIESGEYIEYQAGNKSALVFDRFGNSREIKVKRRGRFNVPKGFFTAKIEGEAELENAPSEVALTIGLFGSFIHN